MTDRPSAYPLAWPVSWKRTAPNLRRESRFRSGGPSKLTVSESINRLQDELDILIGKSGDAILSTNHKTRLDGRPYAEQAGVVDVGAALYFTLKGKPIVLACDRWDRVADNIAALAAHIQAMRGMDRWGVGSVEQLFTGYMALAGPMVPDDWRAAFDNPATLAEAEAAYRTRMRAAHPDAGGSTAQAAALNAAIAEARKVLR